MKKFFFLLGALAGFILGSRAGTYPYQELASSARRLAERPEVRRIIGKVKDTATEQAASAAHKAGDRAASAVGSLVQEPPTEESYADPQDAQFGAAAAKKEELLDQVADRGVLPEALPDEPKSARPRAAGKAEPVDKR